MDQHDANRYSRQIRLPSVGEHGQQSLLDARCLIIGMGGLGSPAAMYLAAAGVGQLVISDFDRVEDSNLQRQIAHRSVDIGEPKAISAKRTLEALNPRCRITAIDWQLDDEELADQVAKADVVLDCSDNFATRFALNRQAFQSGTPLVSGAAIRTEGQIATFLPQDGGPCYQCIYPGDLEGEESCALEGVLAPVVGVMGSMQALQALLVLLGRTAGLAGRLLLFDALAMEWQSVRVPRDEACPVCAGRKAVHDGD
ncbi:MAG: molybdopterin-synthase adenylyltransferase MoeB [Chromatiales bacterium]|nr:molybdopterin-synthase adenylyltransferase MoeB [Chromatiales bacterium]